MTDIMIDHYKKLSLDQPHEIQAWKDSQFNRWSKKRVKFLSHYFNNTLEYRLRRSISRFLNKIACFFDKARKGRYQKLSYLFFKIGYFIWPSDPPVCPSRRSLRRIRQI
jgi:hypothetical protein